MTNVDHSLLLAEWVRIDDMIEFCPVCREGSCAGHVPGCQMDTALSERGFCTVAERDAARARIAAAHAGTEPPPAS